MHDHDSRDPLTTTLRTWRHQPTPAPDFATHVWARIHADETAATPANVVRFPFPVSLPLAASIAITLSILAGAGAALALNRAPSADYMAAAYVRTIDPVQMTSGHTHTGPHS